MPKRGPGKFSADLDELLYEVSLNQGYDDEASFPDGGGWFALFERGFDESDLRSFESEYRKLYNRLSQSERDMLFESAGFILHERSDGIVDVSAYKTRRDLLADWKVIEEDTDQAHEDAGDSGW